MSGRWEMNAAKSTLPRFRNQDGAEGGGVHISGCCIPKSLIEVIHHTEPTLDIASEEVDLDDQGKEHPASTTTRVTTNNRPSANGSRSHWEFDQLVTQSGGDGPQIYKIRTLSADGATLTEDTFLGSREGRPVMTLVMEKRAP